MPSLVSEFYKAYDTAILKNKSRVKLVFKPLDVVKVRGVQVSCSQTDNKFILGYAHRDKNDLNKMMKIQSLDNMKAWLGLMIGTPAPLWLEEGAIIEKKEMDIPV